VGIGEFAAEPWNENEYGKRNNADVDQAVQPLSPIYGREIGSGHFAPDN
jgi:hypothetical protein